MAHSSDGVFVTGTDTGVGKTWVAVHIIQALRRYPLSVCALKPVESGCVKFGEALWPRDAAQLRQAAGQKKVDEVVKFALHLPVAPAAAAQREGIQFDLEDLVQFCARDQLRVVEGAGGWRAPLAPDGDCQTLAQRLGLPVLVVAKDVLGAVNHTLLTCEAVRKAGCRLAGVVLNQQTAPEISCSNSDLIARLLPDVPLWQTGPNTWLDEDHESALLKTFADLPDLPPSPAERYTTEEAEPQLEDLLKPPVHSHHA